MSLKDKKVLLTSGPTWVAIDAVRVISNISSGTLGRRLAKELCQAGAKVTMLEGPVKNPRDIKGVKKHSFTYFDQLHALLKIQLKNHFDIVIHAAAVSDYKCKRVSPVKIRSKQSELALTLVPTQKLIGIIKRLSPQSLLVGFKLETSLSKRRLTPKVKTLFEKDGCDLVIANSLSQGKYHGQIMTSANNIVAKADSRSQLVKKLVTILKREK